ncbi:MAG: DUF3108 domain-containing protein [Stenotrophobium sp.]
MMRKLILLTLLVTGVATAADTPIDIGAPVSTPPPASTAVQPSASAPAQTPGPLPPSASSPAAVTADATAATAEAIALLKTGDMSFSVDWNSIPLGDATITLSSVDGKGCYRYESVTNPVGPVRWIYGSPHELSLFCIKDGVIQPSHYEYDIRQRPKDSFTLDFDWKNKRVKTIKGGNVTLRDLPDIAYDRFGLQQAIRLWVIQHANDPKPPPPAEFITVDDKDINHYKFAILGREKVVTPVGSFDAIRVDRVDSETRSTRSWVAPARDYQVIKVESVNRGNVELGMLLNK